MSKTLYLNKAGVVLDIMEEPKYLAQNEETGIWYFYTEDDGKAKMVLDSNGNFLKLLRYSDNPSDRDVDSIVTIGNVPEGMEPRKCMWTKDGGFEKYGGEVTPTNGELLTATKDTQTQIDDINTALADLIGA